MLAKFASCQMFVLVLLSFIITFPFPTQTSMPPYGIGTMSLPVKSIPVEPEHFTNSSSVILPTLGPWLELMSHLFLRCQPLAKTNNRPRRTNRRMLRTGCAATELANRLLCNLCRIPDVLVMRADLHLGSSPPTSPSPS